MPTDRLEARRDAARARARLYACIRSYFTEQGFTEVETPTLVPAPGMEPHITAFEVPFVPEMPGPKARTLYLHTSPEYAMKRLLAEGFGSVFQICRTYRNGEVATLHNPEFTMLEFYRADADYGAIMTDLEELFVRAAEAQGVDVLVSERHRVKLSRPFERLTVRDAFLTRTGIDLRTHATAESLRSAATAKGLHVSAGASWEDAFFQIFLEAIEPTLGVERPTFLIEYPASMASLSRLKPGDPSVAERFELYVGGVELANGFSELTDAKEQRERLVDEQAQRRSAGRPVYPLDERFLEAVGRMPRCAGVAVGLDRVLMLLLGAQRIEEVLLFPASEFLQGAPD